MTRVGFCGTVGALGAHPRADEPHAVLGARQHAAHRYPEGRGARPEWIIPMPEPPMPTDDAGAQTAYQPASSAPTAGAINVASVDPSITMVQLERDHALVVV